jgi:hypothetical protein
MIPSEKVLGAVPIGEEGQEEEDTEGDPEVDQPEEPEEVQAVAPVVVHIGKAHRVVVPVMFEDLHPAPIKLLRNKYKSVV